MAALTLITRVGDVKYFICDTYANLTSQTPNWTGALCRVDDGTWYEWRQFNDDLGNGSWEVYTGSPIALAIGTGAISATNPLPIKEGFHSSTPLVIFTAISATPATPVEIVVKDTYSEIKIFTSGTSTSRTMTFKAKKDASATALPWLGMNWSDGLATIAVQTTGKDEIWSFSGFGGIYSLVFNVSTIAGGNFTVTAEGIE